MQSARTIAGAARAVLAWAAFPFALVAFSLFYAAQYAFVRE